MKIAVASDDGKHIAQHFGRTRGFLIFDCIDDKIASTEYKLNTFTHHHQGNGDEHHHEHGHQHSHDGILSALKDCKVVISRGMGRRLLDDFEEHGKEIYITDESEAEKAIQLFFKGDLTHLPGKSCQH
ncbi:MAG: iron-molybdenum cofactor biosynthesis protein [Bacteroidetes bacterium]|nr:iron-molybdenum cofactor biosynthesis protein [Bacteroidota bacterium]